MTRSAVVVACVFGVLCIAQRSVTALEDGGGSQQVIGEVEEQLQSPIHDSLVTSSIIPDVLDDFTPAYSLLITYPGTHSTVTLGNTLSPSSVKDPAVYQFQPLFPDPAPGPIPPSRNRSYTLVLTDPDAKSRKNPIWSEFCHWVVANVSSPQLPQQPHKQGDNDRRQPFPFSPAEYLEPSWRLKPESVPEPNVLESYYPPSPPKGTGLHRYVFVLLEGDTAASQKLSAPAERKHWGYGKSRHGVRDWAAEYGLEVVGANFFYAQNEADDTV